MKKEKCVNCKKPKTLSKIEIEVVTLIGEKKFPEKIYGESIYEPLYKKDIGFMCKACAKHYGFPIIAIAK